MNPTNTPFSVQTVGARRRGPKRTIFKAYQTCKNPRFRLKKNQNRLFLLPFSKNSSRVELSRLGDITTSLSRKFSTFRPTNQIRDEPHTNKGYLLQVIVSNGEEPKRRRRCGVCTVVFLHQENKLRHSRRESAKACDASSKAKGSLAFN